MKKLMIVAVSLTCLCFQCLSTCFFPGNARITVVDRNHNEVSGATVTIKDQSNHVVASGKSDVKGLYIYEQRGPKEEVLEVVVDSPNDLYHGAGIISLQEQGTTELTIMID